jgi:hypothetical protein
VAQDEFAESEIMMNKQHDAAKEIDRMMQCSDETTFRLPVDINRTSHKLVLTKY